MQENQPLGYDFHPDRLQPATFDCTPTLNSEWQESARGRRITVLPRRVISSDTKLLAIGSCFAVEIRSALRALGHDVYPKYFDLGFDERTQRLGALPARDNINHYDTFVMRQEIERALEGKKWHCSDFWTLDASRADLERGWKQVCQDPYRKHIYGADMDALSDLSDRIGRCIADGLAAADVVILTLGLTECWRNRANGRFVCMGPSTAKSRIFPMVEFHPSTFAENYENLNAILNSIWNAFPDKTVVVSVSPVALARTWTGEDIVVANLTSKSTLRAVAGQVSRERPNLIYWPSYEFAMVEDVFRADGRHVRRDAVQRIISSFLEAHQTETPAVPKTDDVSALSRAR